jgi:hypothetical protein
MDCGIFLPEWENSRPGSADLPVWGYVREGDLPKKASPAGPSWQKTSKDFRQPHEYIALRYLVEEILADFFSCLKSDDFRQPPPCFLCRIWSKKFFEFLLLSQV